MVLISGGIIVSSALGSKILKAASRMLALAGQSDSGRVAKVLLFVFLYTYLSVLKTWRARISMAVHGVNTEGCLFLAPIFVSKRWYFYLSV